jgi:hypothetical protein
VFADERRRLSPIRVADEGRVSPPPGFAGGQGFDIGIVLPPAWGVSLRALTDDLILPQGLSIGGPASRTHRSDRITGICRTVPIKNTGSIHIDLTEDLGSESESIARRGPRSMGGATLGATRKCPKTRGGAAIGGTARGDVAIDGAVRGGVATRGGGLAARSGGTAATGGGAAARGGGTAARGGGATTVKGRGGGNVSSSNQVKGKRIVTCIEKWNRNYGIKNEKKRTRLEAINFFV